jgi:hypothetical protein
VLGEPKGQRLIRHIDRNSLVSIQKTGYQIFARLSRGTVKVLKHPEVQKVGQAPETISLESALKKRRMQNPLPNDQKGAIGVEESAPSTLSALTDQGTPSRHPD